MLLQVNNLRVRYPDFELHPLSLTLEEGEILSVIGESGSGKTTLARGISCLLGPEAEVEGQVLLEGEDLTAMPEKQRKKLRMERFSVAFQSSRQYLNPTMPLNIQLREILDRQVPRKDQPERMAALMESVGLSREDLHRYPRELSGGMVQKFLLACAIALKPKLVILDEPTSSLDRRSSEEFASLIETVNRENRIAFLMITHDMAIAARLSSRMLVLYEGHVMEEGRTPEIMAEPRHPYTRGLMNSSIPLNIAKDIWGIPQREESRDRHCCPFCSRCTQGVELCRQEPPRLEVQSDGRQVACHRGGIVTVLEGRHIARSFGRQQVLKDCSLRVLSGETIALVGPSGVGKTTLARILSGFDPGDYRGTVLFSGEKADFTALHKARGGVQMVFQDSESALNPRMTVLEAVSEPLLLWGAQEEERIRASREALKDVGLPELRDQKIRTLSGGQKQRIALARALTMEPELLIADEPTAMLDPSSCANVLRLLKTLQNQRGLSMLIITHDLDSAAKISDSIYLLREGSLRKLRPSDFIRNELDALM